MDKKYRSMACRLWRNEGQLKAVKDLLMTLTEKEGTLPAEASQTLEGILSIVHDVAEDLGTIGYEIYPITKGNND